MKREIGSCFKEIRTAKGFTQEKFSKIIGISKKQYCRLEKDSVECKINWILNTIFFFGNDILDFWINYLYFCKKNYDGIEYQTIFLEHNLLSIKKEKKKVEKDLLLSQNLFLDHEYRTIFMMYLNYKIDNDLENLKNSLDTRFSLYNLEKDFEILPLIIQTLENETILEILGKLSLKNIANVKDSSTTFAYIFLNGLGELLKSYKDDWNNQLATHFSVLNQILLKENLHFLLPIYYRHYAKYFLCMDDFKNYSIQKERALLLANIFEQNNVYESIILDFSKL